MQDQANAASTLHYRRDTEEGNTPIEVRVHIHSNQHIPLRALSKVAVSIIKKNLYTRALLDVSV